MGSKSENSAMEVYFLRFEDAYIIYRPLRHLAFVGNKGLVRYIKQRLANGGEGQTAPKVEEFLEAIDFWAPDPPVEQQATILSEYMPSQAVLLMTTACNLSCIYCYAHAGESQRQDMSVELAKAVIDQAYENAQQAGRQWFGLTFHGGGEPTMNWETLVAATEYARQKDLPCDVSMSTNGMWTDEQRHWIVEHFTGLSLSFDGIPRVQNAQRPRPDGSGSFAAVMETIAVLDEKELPYGIRMTVTPEFFATLPESIAFVCEHTKCARMQVEPTYKWARGDYSQPGPGEGDRFAQAFLDAFEVAAREGRQLYYSGARPWVIAPTFCTAPSEALVVTPAADIVTCFEVTGRNHPLASNLMIGHVSVADGVDIQFGKLAAFFESQQQRRQGCRDCFCYWHCAGDCVVRCALKQQPSRRQGRCAVNRRITRELIARYVAQGDGVWRGEATQTEFSV